MKPFVLIFLTFSLVLSFSFNKQKTNSIIGNWESVNSKNARRIMIKFNRNKTFIIENVLSADYTYQIKKNKMITKLLNLHTGKEIIDTLSIKLKGDTLESVFNRKGKLEKTIMVRIPGSIKYDKNIVGVYTWKYPNGHTAFSKFTKNKHWIFRLPITIEKGNYEINKNIISFDFADDKTKTVESRKFWTKGKLLILSDKKTHHDDLYKKVDYFLDK